MEAVELARPATVEVSGAETRELVAKDSVFGMFPPVNRGTTCAYLLI